VTRWSGECLDYGIAIDSLLYRTHNAPELLVTEK
jgi:hypothetical protein